MKKSDQINEIAKALVQVQKVLKSAKKTSENPFFKAKYADLAEVWDTCHGVLTENSLAVTQTMDHENGINFLITTLLHTSGQYISSRLVLYSKDNSPQAIGSAITYARRYSLAAIVGVVTEDDDGEAAMARNSHSPVKVVPQQVDTQKLPGKGLTEKQIKFLKVKQKEFGWDDMQVNEYVSSTFDKPLPGSLTTAELTKLLNHMQSNTAPRFEDFQ